MTHPTTFSQHLGRLGSQEASVQAKRTARGAERDTQPLLLKHVGPDYTFWFYPTIEIFHIWGHYGRRYPKGPR